MGGGGGGDSDSDGSGDNGDNGGSGGDKDNGGNSNDNDYDNSNSQLFFLPLLTTVGPSEGTIAHVVHSDKNDGLVAGVGTTNAGKCEEECQIYKGKIRQLY